jgi:hypothetical protein
MRVREFTDRGVKEFEKYLDGLEGSKNFSKPDLNKHPYSNPANVEIDIDPEKSFETRAEIGEYLANKLDKRDVDRADLLSSTGLWTWLTYIWLDNFIFWKDGKVDLRERARYICSRDWKRYYRHYVSINYLLVSLHGTENTKIFLEYDARKYKDTIEQLVSYQNILNNQDLVAIANDLYWDSNKEKVKTNAGGRKSAPGTARRFNKVMEQLRKTFYLPQMEQEQIRAIMPDEFDEWDN